MVKTVHEGRNIKRIREILGIKQEALAIDLGTDWTQKKISLLEAKDTVEPELLDQVAKAMKVPVDAIRNFTEEGAVNIVSSSFHDYASVNSNSLLTFNPLEKVVELYERMLVEKNELIEKLMSAKKD